MTEELIGLYQQAAYDDGYKQAIKDLEHLCARKTIRNEYKGIEEYKELTKKSLCEDLARYLYENGLVKFEEQEIKETRETVIYADVRVFKGRQFRMYRSKL